MSLQNMQQRESQACVQHSWYFTLSENAQRDHALRVQDEHHLRIPSGNKCDLTLMIKVGLERAW